jgi:hypothetical protein
VEQGIAAYMRKREIEGAAQQFGPGSPLISGDTPIKLDEKAVKFKSYLMTIIAQNTRAEHYTHHDVHYA